MTVADVAPRGRARRAAAARRLAVALVVLAACGGKAVFRLSSDENNPDALREALARRDLPASATPTNDAHQPRVFAVIGATTRAPGDARSGGAAGEDRAIVAFDLAGGRALWKAGADVRSRIAVGGDFIVAIEGKQLVARDQARGAPRWRADVPGDLIGLAADRERAYVVYRAGSRWWLAGYAGDRGAELWRADGAGELGAPAAHGGVVYVPFLHQWLSIVDGRTGKQLTRIRGIDEQIAMVRTTSQVAYYGSRQGVFVLDARSGSGKRADSTYGQVPIPAQLERTTYGPDAYDPVHQTYSAADRARVLWRSVGDDRYAIHYFRFVFGFGAGGALRWAYSHPRVELVATEQTGAVIAAVSATGDVVAIDAATGAVRSRGSLGAPGPVIGATFDADGWSPTGEVERSDTVAALVGIARDRDARFDRVKDLAVAALARLPGAEVTTQLLAVIADPRAPQRLKDTVVDLLVERRDPASLPVLVAQLAVHADYLAQTDPDALGPVARAIAGLGDAALDPAQVAAALAALQSHLDAPTTASTDLVHVIAAMAAIGGGAERLALGSHLLLYHADDELGADPAWQQAIVDALAHAGGPAGRELLRYVAADPRTKAGLATAARAAVASD